MKKIKDILEMETELSIFKMSNIAEWSSGSSLGSYPKGHKFESCLRNYETKWVHHKVWTNEMEWVHHEVLT